MTTSENPSASSAQTITDETSGSEAEGIPLERGALVGRYVVIGKLGAGGMGVVVAAYDPELDRRVAIKVLWTDRRSAGGSGKPSSRLLREAQALAKLQHPNIVAVHDVGVVEGRLWLAMELVAGRTLGAWLRERPRVRGEILEVLCAAGRGLAAAHAAGLVHRDFKPDNIMVDDDAHGTHAHRRVRVMDFGLARATDASSSDDASDRGAPRRAVLRESVTHAGSLLDTPAYMAPEQFGDDEIDARADQFAFCVTLWEALYGERPFPGKSVVEVAAKVMSGEPRTAPDAPTLPTWLRRTLVRGLAVDRSKRWPDMMTLLDELERGQSRARARRWIGALLGAGVVLGGAAFLHELDVRRRRAACVTDGETISQVWNPDVRDELHRTIVATGVSHAAVTADKVMPWLDAHARRWQAARTEVCLHEVRGQVTPDLHARATWCLDERRMELEALIGEIAQADATVAHEAVAGAAGLAPVDECRDTKTLARLPPAPTEHRDEVQLVRAELSRAGAQQAAGRYDQGVEVADAALARAEAIAWPPLVAAARYRKGVLEDRRGRYAEAARALEDAYFEAAAAGSLDIEADAAHELAYTVGSRLARHAEAMQWERHGELALAALGEHDTLRVARRLNSLGIVQEQLGRYVEARATHERALALKESILGPMHPDVAVTLGNLATAVADTGDLRLAKQLHERAVAIETDAFGPDHPAVAKGLNNLGVVVDALGDAEEALALYQRALAILERAYGPEHIEVAKSLVNVAGEYNVRGEPARARELNARALAILERNLGPDHPHVAVGINNIANVHVLAREYAEAKPLYERALGIFERALGRNHPELGSCLVNLGTVEIELGEFEAARAHLERARTIWERALGADHPHVAHALYGLVKVDLHDHRLVDARKAADRAVALREVQGDPGLLAEARFALARVLWEQDDDRAHAVELVQAALVVVSANPAQLEARAEMQAWLDSHRATP